MHSIILEIGSGITLFTCTKFVQTPPTFLPLRRRRGTFSGSRYFTHDLLLPTDECEDEFVERAGRTSSGSRRPSLHHRSRAATTTEAPNVTQQQSSLLRACSLQAGRTMVHGDSYVKRGAHPSTIVRQYSSPSMQNSPDINCRYYQTSLKTITD
jgi:hypothetical protein